MARQQLRQRQQQIAWHAPEKVSAASGVARSTVASAP